ncbi:ABC transporter ATP-binding protein [Synechococcus sp. PCC 6312]|uniref:ABC transporter ATP-binding protein n=1 Tax=Synechococcus sp. (strain ATCC 27167 / PCC 6312) TaxID=195253 RepID=UPI00029ED62C|nr:ABC-type multidrug transport system, ATPase and permease component [Synechococcus sp. PCC 6312]
MKSNYQALIPYLKPHWRTIGLALVLMAGFVGSVPLIAYLVGQAAALIGAGDIPGLLQWVGGGALLFFIRGLLQFGQDTLMARAALEMTLDIRQSLYRHLQFLGLDYFETAATGDLTYRLTEDVDRVGEVVHKGFHQFLPAALTMLTILSYLFYLNWRLTLATAIVAPLMASLVAWFGGRILNFSRLSQNRISNLSALLTEVFSGIRLVKAFAAEEYEIQRFYKAAEKNRQARYAAERVKAIQHPVVGFLESVSVMILFLLGAWQIGAKQLTGAEFLSFVAGVALLIDPINAVTANFNEYKQAEASVDRVFELFQLQPNVQEKKQAPPLPPLSGKIEYRHVSFAYRSGQPVLQQFNLLALPGEVIAFVGHSGAGKTTIVNLLPRFYDPQAGSILIDGIDIRGVSLRSLRQQIGIVPQETVLFSGTVAQNIAFGQRELDYGAIREAAKIANADQFIDQLPEGYETWLGERGVNLSGGQRQRLAIARAILLNPRILILDEATSALDSASERLVQEALERAMQDRTVFIIAHRLTTVRKADRILVIEQGRVVESGSHYELMNQDGGTSRYARFYAQQLPN